MSSEVENIRQVGSQANALLRQIGDARRRRILKEQRLNARIEKLKEQAGPAIDELKKEEKSLIEQLTQLVLPHFALLVRPGTRTISLRSGEISLRRSSQDSLLVAEGESESAIIRRIKNHGGLRRFTRVGKRTLHKDELKKHPSFVAKIQGLTIARKTSLIIKPARAQGQEIEQELDPLSVPVAIDN